MFKKTLFACFLLGNSIALSDTQNDVFTMSGMLQSEWTRVHAYSAHQHETFHENTFSVQLDLIFDYKTDRTWTTFQIECDNEAGIQKSDPSNCYRNKNILWGSGEGDDIYLCKAFIGYSLIDTKENRLDFEIGRHYLSDLFDSSIEFNNQFDGLLLRYESHDMKKNGLKTTCGAFVIDDRSNHFGYAAEVDLFRLAATPLDLKYSLITWKKKGSNRAGQRHALGNRFVNSQILAGYHLPYDTVLYAAYLHNHAAKRNRLSKDKKAANGWYAGVTIGEVNKKNDWSFDINYQLVQAQSIPEWDVAGIGAFNPTGSSFYSHNFGGFANYKGYSATFWYALTDQLSVQVQYQKAKPANNTIGCHFRANTFEITTVYSF